MKSMQLPITDRERPAATGSGNGRFKVEGLRFKEKGCGGCGVFGAGGGLRRGQPRSGEGMGMSFSSVAGGSCLFESILIA